MSITSTFNASIAMSALTALTFMSTAGMANAAPLKNLPADPNAELSLGANIIITKSAYDVDGSEVRVLPGAFYDNNKFYVRGAQAGAYLINDGTNQLSASVQLAGNVFDPEDANGALSGLDERKASAAAGLTYQRRTPIGGFRAQIATDVLGRNDGNFGRLTYLSRISKDKLTVFPSVGIEWNDEDFNDYYYGVSNEESARTGVAAYSPSQSFSPYVSVSANYDINDKWAGFASQTLNYLSNEQHDSPMVDSRVDSNTVIGLLYKF